ncbi:MAG: hypothetical protein SOZ00_01235 [Tidjanibacter sp.]|nr:hypothetical protein [Tidjanibacter sp.]
MINSIIADYLRTNSRIVIPEVGAFVRRKESNEIVFMEMLKRDDGVLNGLIQNKMGVAQSDAAALLDRYVESMRSELSANKKFIVDSVGVLFANPSGVLDFTYNPFARSIPAPEQHISVLKSADEKPSVPKPTAEPKSVAPEPVVKEQSDALKESAIDDEPDTTVTKFIDKVRHQKEQNEDVEPEKRRVNIRTNRTRIKLDPITILAIVAAILAVASLIWGAIPDRSELEIDTPATEVVSAEEGQ